MYVKKTILHTISMGCLALYSFCFSLRCITYGYYCRYLSFLSPYERMKSQRDINGALILAISTCVGSGAAAGTSVAGSTFFAGPYAVLAGIVTGGVSGGACLAGVYLVYQSAMQNAELKYLETKDKCYSQYNC